MLDMPKEKYPVYVSAQPDGRLVYRRATPLHLVGVPTGKILEKWTALKSITFTRRKKTVPPIIGKWIVHSLETKDLATAHKRQPIVHAAAEMLFGLNNGGQPVSAITVTGDRVEFLADLHKARSLTQDEQFRGIVNFVANMPDYDDGSGDVGEDYDLDAVFNNYVRQKAEQLSRVKKAIARQDKVTQHRIVARILSALGSDFAGLNTDLPTLVTEVLKSEIEQLELVQSRNQGNIVTSPTPSAVIDKYTDGSLLFTTVQEKWVKELKFDIQRGADVAVIMQDFVEIVGDRNIGQYKKEDGRKYKAMLMSLPANWRKLKATRDKSIFDAAAYAVEHGVPSQTDNNINKKIGTVSQFFSWCSRQYDEGIPNPVDGLKIVINDDPAELRDPFTVEQINSILAGVAADKERANETVSPVEFKWIVLIGMFTGARLNEICQLRRCDIEVFEGKHAFVFTANSRKKIKNKASIRATPVHSRLLSLGLLEYIDRYSAQERIFPSLTPNKYGRYSDNAGDKFNRLLAKLNMKTDVKAGAAMLDYHSWRHTMKKQCERSGVIREYYEAILGHSQPGEIRRYGGVDGVGNALLSEKMEQVKFEGVDFSHFETAHTPATNSQ